MRGTITWFDEQRGYGYIHREDGKRILVHQSDLQETGDTPLQDVGAQSLSTSIIT